MPRGRVSDGRRRVCAARVPRRGGWGRRGGATPGGGRAVWRRELVGVAQKVRAAEADWRAARALLVSYGLVVEPVLAADAERAAALWERGSGLSLADRLC